MQQKLFHWYFTLGYVRCFSANSCVYCESSKIRQTIEGVRNIKKCICKSEMLTYVSLYNKFLFGHVVNFVQFLR